MQTMPYGELQRAVVLFRLFYYRWDAPDDEIVKEFYQARRSWLKIRIKPANIRLIAWRNKSW